MSDADWSWLRAYEAELGSKDVDALSERLTEGVAKVDARLAIEVSDQSGTRTAVITAGGEAEAFAAARRLAASAPAIPGWRFVALRPARGFDFEVDAGGLVFEAKALSFQPIPDAEAPTQLAIRLLVPNPQLEAWSEIGLQIIEAGIGEEAASRIGYLEIGKRQDDSENVFALESLEGWIERHSSPVG